MSYQYIISRWVPQLRVGTRIPNCCPGVSIPSSPLGLAAAATRITREETEKGRSTAETVQVFKRRVGLWWESENNK